ncbi:MAG TPA: 30S ribosomal protein S24e [Candidatus Thermoplasmatota archaeon]|nr:30S ribosomal protein S24e [Candidatus Thermoplasmatota archaeon]
MMDIEIIEKKHNPLLSRWEVRFQVHHQGEKTPTRDGIREKIAGQLNSKKGNVVVDSMASAFGRSSTRGYVRVYDTQEALAKNEPHYILKRNKLEELKPKKVAKVQAAAAPKKGAPKARK